jgi:hypothetical protein
VSKERLPTDKEGVNHPLMVRAHREHGLDEAEYGFWGFSRSSDPSKDPGYREFGVDAVGLNPKGYYSDIVTPRRCPTFWGPTSTAASATAGRPPARIPSSEMVS